MGEGEPRSLAETPTWSVATVMTGMVAVCFIVERSIYRFGKVYILAVGQFIEVIAWIVLQNKGCVGFAFAVAEED